MKFKFFLFFELFGKINKQCMSFSSLFLSESSYSNTVLTVFELPLTKFKLLDSTFGMLLYIFKWLYQVMQQFEWPKNKTFRSRFADRSAHKNVKHLWGDSLLSTNKFAGMFGTNFTDEEGWKFESTIEPHMSLGLEIKLLDHQGIIIIFFISYSSFQIYSDLFKLRQLFSSSHIVI